MSEALTTGWEPEGAAVLPAGAHGAALLGVAATGPLGRRPRTARAPGARGHGYGEALTWRATLAEPDLPAVLIASDPGRPVYERMGFLSVVRFTVGMYGGKS